MISVCFRFDDPSPTSDHDLEGKILEVFSQFDSPLCVAAIPFRRTPEGRIVQMSSRNASHLIDALGAGVIEIAQHGHSHIRRGKSASGGNSEFAGVPMAEQTCLIKEGMEQLSSVFGQHIKGFVPPWNTYDLPTARVVEEAGFEFLSAGWEVFTFGNLAIVPRTCSMRNARDAIEQALRFQFLSPVVVLVFHPDEFEEFKYPPAPGEPAPFTKISELEALLRWIKTKPEIKVNAISEIAQSTRNGTPLWSPQELRLPYRVKALVPQTMLVRSNKLRTLATMMGGALRRRYAMGR